MALRDQLLKEFEKVDTGKTGLISLDELKALVKSLNPDFTDDELKTICDKLSVSDGKVKFKEFVSLFAGAKNKNISADLAKAPSEGELEALKEVFKKYDKDGSGQIDLKELQSMCGDLGKKLPDEQAAQAMQQLDKDGNMQCNFDEFTLWYTCTPGMGGYGHVALSFMKAQIAMKSGIRKITKRAKKSIDNVDEFVLKGAVDVSPNADASKEACSVAFAMRKADGATNATPRITVQMTAKNPDAAASLIAQLEAFLNDAEDPCPLPITCRQEGAKMFFSTEAPPDMFEDEGLVKGLGFLEECTKKLEGKVSLGVNFEDALKNPDRPLILHFQGGKVDADVNIGLTALVNFFARDGIPPEAEAMLKVLSAVLKDVRITYNDASLMAIAGKLKEKAKSSPFMGDQASLMKTLMGSLADARAKMYTSMSDSEVVKDGKWSEGCSKPAKAEQFLKMVREMSTNVVGIDQVVFDGIPNSSVQFVATFEKVNPFPVANYLMGSWPKDPNGGKDAVLSRTQSSAETDKLKEAFGKFDKDGSGAIDVKELKTMITDLGGKITDEEVEAAMKELDTNKDGTCCFEEFKEFWSSKPGLGGYGNVTLKFLKAKMAAGSMLEKGRGFLGKASGYLGEASAEDTVIRFVSEVSPNCEEVQEKMSMTFAIDQTDVKAEGAPRGCLKLGSKSTEAATEIVKKVNEAIEPVAPMMEMMGVNLSVSSSDKTVEFTLNPPDGMMDMVYSDADVMKTITPLIKALKQSNAKSIFANEFDDFLAKPDTPLTEVFKGAKGMAELFVMAKGKKLFLDAMPGQKKMEVQILKEAINLLAGAQVTYQIGYHPSNLAALIKVNDMVAQAAPPSGAREIISSMVPIEMMPVEELKPFVDAGVYVLERLECIESVGVVNVDLPVEFAANGLPATVGATLTGSNFKPFGLIKYLADPTLAKFNMMTEA